MAAFLDRVVGVYHFLGDGIPRDVPRVEPKQRRVNPWRKDNKVIVAKAIAKGDARVAINTVIALLGNIEQVFSRGDKVLIKPNFNSPDPFPAATDLAFLRAVIELVLETGAKVTVGESAGAVWRPSRKVFHKLGVPILCGLGIALLGKARRPKTDTH